VSHGLLLLVSPVVPTHFKYGCVAARGIGILALCHAQMRVQLQYLVDHLRSHGHIVLHIGRGLALLVGVDDQMSLHLPLLSLGALPKIRTWN
jgi:hypothetical protein